MKPQLFALLTAIAWDVCGYFEKIGLHIGNLSPQMGIMIRTFIALTILGLVSYPYWSTVPQAGPKAMLYMIIGGGVVAGAGGDVIFLYRHQGSAAEPGDAHCLYLTTVWRVDGIYFWQ